MMRIQSGYFSLFFILFYILVNLQTLSVKGWVDIDEETSVKAYHLFSLLFIPGFIFAFKDKIPSIPPYIIHYFAGTVLISIILYFVYPFNRMIINYVFAFYIFYIGYYIASIYDEAYVIRILQNVTVLIFIVVYVKLLFHLPQIKAFIKSPWGHPDVFTIYGGGVNLEATWLSMNAALFINRRKLFIIFVSASLFISILYASRVGVVISVLVSALYFFSPSTSPKERKYFIAFLLLAACSLVFFIDFSDIANDIYALKRFTEVGGSTDKGMAGRFAMWKHYGDALWNSFFTGYGAGNGIYAVEAVSKLDYIEDNLHNLYMQILIEIGLLGLILYLIIVFNISIKALKTKFLKPLSIILIVYFIASLIQFRGTDAMIWLYIGLFLKFESNNINLNEQRYSSSDTTLQ